MTAIAVAIRILLGDGHFDRTRILTMGLRLSGGRSRRLRVSPATWASKRPARLRVLSRMGAYRKVRRGGPGGWGVSPSGCPSLKPGGCGGETPARARRS